MQKDKRQSIGIIGAGFCGIMTLVHLVRNATAPLSITVFNKKHPRAKGIAYHTYSDLHLLNVEAKNMSAFTETPDHFVRWCERNQIQNQKGELSTSYLPRNIYGKYLESILNDTLKEKPTHIDINFVDDEVTDVDSSDETFSVHTSSGNSYSAHKIVLATGNEIPGDPSVKNTSFLKSPNYFNNPWSEDAVSFLPKNKTILIIGTGLTMVDTVLGLKEKNFDGKIIALSPRGFKILPHRKHHPQRLILDELEPPYDLNTVFRLFYKHVRMARTHGQSGETVVDAVRSKTQEIWQHLSLSDKKKFMTHLRHMWGLARHRLPGHIHNQVEGLINESKLEVIAGKISDIIEDDFGIHITINRRADQQNFTLNVARVINCTGPQTDIRKQKGKLYLNLIAKKLITPDEMNLGIHATADGRVIEATGTAGNRIFTLGSLLKGRLWESTAVPELRTQAKKVADLLLSSSE